MLKHYAIYQGEEFLYEGTAQECADYLNIQVTTVRFLNSNAYKKRIKNSKNAKVAIAIEDEEEQNEKI